MKYFSFDFDDFRRESRHYYYNIADKETSQRDQVT